MPIILDNVNPIVPAPVDVDISGLENILLDIRPWVNNCPDVTIKKNVVKTVRDFCRDTWYYQATTVFNQVDGTSTYQIVPSDDSEVIAVESVDLADDVKLYPITVTEGSRGDGSVTGFTFEPPNYLSIFPEPTESVTNGIEVRLVLMPPEDTDSIPTSIYRNHKQVIVSGALGYILSMQNEAWSNPKMAAEELQKFVIGCFNAKGQRARDFRPGSIRIKYRPFAI